MTAAPDSPIVTAPITTGAPAAAESPGGGEPFESDDEGTPSGLTGKVRMFLRRLTANTDSHDAAQLQKHVASLGATPIKRCSAGCRTSVVGTIRSITLQPVTGTPALHADLWDGTGSLRLVWLGRRQIPGIDPGRALRVEGRVIDEHGHHTMYNPRYELRSGVESTEA
jgi:hypothetical protein